MVFDLFQYCITHLHARNSRLAGFCNISGSDTVLAYQLGAGIDYMLTNYLNLDLGYRFFNSIRPELTETDGQKLKMDYMSHSIVFGLRVGF